MKRKGLLHKLLWMLLILLGGVVGGTLLLFLSFLLPNSILEKHMGESREALVQTVGTSEVIFGYQSTYDGISTDCLMLQAAIYNGDHSVLDSAMGIYRNELAGDYWNPRMGLLDYLDGKQDVEVSYPRYWHGYLIILKPLLMIFNWGEIKFFNLFAQVVLLGSILYFMIKRELAKYAIAYGVGFLFLVPIILPSTLSLSICFYLYTIANLVQLIWHEKMCEKGLYLYFFLIAGIATAYFDYLTYPITVLGIPLTLYFILGEKQEWKEKLGRILGYSMTWGVGYIGMWASKWILGSFILQTNVLLDAQETLSERTATIDSSSRFLSWVNVVLDNVKQYRALPYRVFLLVLIVFVIWMIIKHPVSNGWKDKIMICIPYACIALFPFAWYAVALNHSGEHYMFTFRALSVTAFAGTAMMMTLFERKCDKDIQLKKR